MSLPDFCCEWKAGWGTVVADGTVGSVSGVESVTCVFDFVAASICPVESGARSVCCGMSGAVFADVATTNAIAGVSCFGEIFSEACNTCISLKVRFPLNAVVK